MPAPAEWPWLAEEGAVNPEELLRVCGLPSENPDDVPRDLRAPRVDELLALVEFLPLATDRLPKST